MAGIAEVRREMPVRLSRRGGHFVFTCICFFTPRISPLVALYERHRIFFRKISKIFADLGLKAKRRGD